MMITRLLTVNWLWTNFKCQGAEWKIWILYPSNERTILVSIPVSRQAWDLEFGQSVEFWRPWQSTYSWSWSGGRRWEKKHFKTWNISTSLPKGLESLIYECTRKKAPLWSKSYRKTPKIACMPLGAFSDIFSFSIQIAGAVTAAAATLVTIYCIPESALDGLQLTLPFCICTWVLLTRWEWLRERRRV